jgi:hypothetical protein
VLIVGIPSGRFYHRATSLSPGLTVEAPVEAPGYKLAFTASPARLREAGWMQARIFSPEELPEDYTRRAL